MALTDIYALSDSLLGTSDTVLSTGSPMLLRSRSANDVMKQASALPPLSRIAGSLWHEDEVTVLFAPTGIGKSILAVQIAIQCAGGLPIDGLDIESAKAPTLYCDFELGDRSFSQRYKDSSGTPFEFPSLLYRVDFNPDFTGCDAEESLLRELEEQIVETRARYVIVDNVSAMKGTLEKGKDAGALFMALKQIKQRCGVSMLIVAHTPKRDASQPLTINDLAGSSQISNLSDSVFALGKSAQGKQRIYAKQVKTRNDEMRHGEDNVLVFDKTTKHGYLHMEYVGVGIENAHLPKKDDVRNEKEEEAREMLEQGATQRTVATQTGISVGAVNGISQRLKSQRAQTTQPTKSIDPYDWSKP